MSTLNTTAKVIGYSVLGAAAAAGAFFLAKKTGAWDKLVATHGASIALAEKAAVEYTAETQIVENQQATEVK